MSKYEAGKKTVMVNGIAVGDIIATGDIEKDASTIRQYLKDKGLHHEISPFQAVLSQAVAFANTSALLYERDLRRLPRKVQSTIPFVVNAAFSIELYLKALGRKHGLALRGHELMPLYESLPQEALASIDAVIPQCALKRDLGEAPQFVSYLRDLNDAFVEWRYCFELERTKPFHIEPTIFVIQVLHGACHFPATA